MEVGRLDVESVHLLIRHLDALLIGASVDPAGNGETGFSAGVGDQLHNDLMADQRLATPVLGDEGKQSMLDAVPFAGSWWQTVIAIRSSSARTCSSRFHRRTRGPLLPPQSAVINNGVAAGYRAAPSSCHQRRMLSTAKAAVSWLMPRLTHPVLAAMS